VYEVLSGTVPFHQYNEPVALLKILHGEHPERPSGRDQQAGGGGGGGSRFFFLFPDGLWETLRLCWRKEPSGRPGLDAVLRTLQDPTRFLSRSSFDVVGGYHDRTSDAAINESSTFAFTSNPIFPSLSICGYHVGQYR
jgi:hypothetical protein